MCFKVTAPWRCRDTETVHERPVSITDLDYLRKIVVICLPYPNELSIGYFIDNLKGIFFSKYCFAYAIENNKCIESS